MSSDNAIPTDGLTEEEAMNIWLRGRERLWSHPPPTRGTFSPPLHITAGGSSGSAIQSRAITAPALLSTNALGGENIVAYQDAHEAYQRFINVNRPAGLADASVLASTLPGLVQLVEQHKRQEDLSRLYNLYRHLEEQRHHLQEEMDMIRQTWEGLGGGGGGVRQVATTSTSSLAPPVASGSTRVTRGEVDQLAAQAREYERLSRAHRSNKQQQEKHTLKAAAMARAAISSSSNYDDNDSTSSSSNVYNNKEKDGRANDFYLATPYQTQYNTQSVRCIHCTASLHTHPIAENYFCQKCCQITLIRKSEDVSGSMKMDSDDSDDKGVGRYPIGTVSGGLANWHCRGW